MPAERESRPALGSSGTADTSTTTEKRDVTVTATALLERHPRCASPACPEATIYCPWCNRQPCPPEHLWRLVAALVDHCPEHGCPICATTPPELPTSCWECVRRAVAVAEHEGPAADPWCLIHGPAAPARRRECSECDLQVRRARRRGWRKPTGHEGVECVHCAVCGVCAGSGRVCRHCWRCPEHPVDETFCPAPDCLRITEWGRGRRRRDVEFYEHSYFDLATYRWSA